jgi:SAM-dependent methyltransferase
VTPDEACRIFKVEPKPRGLSRDYANQFGDAAVVAAYERRPPYPASLDPLFVELAGGPAAHLLDLGCGTGELARRLAPQVGAITAIDQSERMLALARALPGGDAPNLTWIAGRVEDVALAGPFSSALAAESFHWFDWPALARRLTACVPSRRLILAERHDAPTPWAPQLATLIARFSTNREFQSYDLLEELTARRLLVIEGRMTEPLGPFAQSIDDYVTSLHSRNGLSRDRMTVEAAAAFDAGVRAAVAPHATDGRLAISSATRVVWGRLGAA